MLGLSVRIERALSVVSMAVDYCRDIISSRSMSTLFIASSIAQRPILKSQIEVYRLFMLDKV